MSKDYLLNMELFEQWEYPKPKSRNPYTISFNRYKRMHLSQALIKEITSDNPNAVSVEIYLAKDVENDIIAVTAVPQPKAQSVAINLETQYGSIGKFLKRFNMEPEKVERYQLVDRQDEWYIFGR